ncbi:MAG: cbb3-type cytochrome oxidase assembly protein [Acidobacteriota bacterium]
METRTGYSPNLQAVPTDTLEPSPKARLFLWLFSLAMVLTAGSAFFMKLIEFYATATREGSDALASFLIPVLNYLLVAAGFFCLFLWAYLSGQFRDLEAAKFRMLEMQDEIDHSEMRAK